jgi:hypothetical protein
MIKPMAMLQQAMMSAGAARERSALPASIMAAIQSLLALVTGGSADFDCALNRMADQVVAMDATTVPLTFRAWIPEPKEVVDMILEQLDFIGFFRYTATLSRTGGTWTARVIDQASGHLVEEIEGLNPEQLREHTARKYGPNIEVICHGVS